MLRDNFSKSDIKIGDERFQLTLKIVHRLFLWSFVPDSFFNISVNSEDRLTHLSLFNARLLNPVENVYSCNSK